LNFIKKQKSGILPFDKGKIVFGFSMIQSDKGFLKRKYKDILLALFVGLLLISNLFFYFKISKLSLIAPVKIESVLNLETESTTENVTVGAQVNVQTDDPNIKILIDNVFKHIFLPSGDVRVETITNPDKLRSVNPIFYQNAKEGDMILIFNDRAVLYDPTIDRVLDVYHTSGVQ
jgi:hypothetical protein